MGDEYKKYDSYLGDGVYVSYDGWQIELKANNHQTPTDTIYLEPSVIRALIQYTEALKKAGEALDV